MNLTVGDKAIITTDAWFFAPDGKEYRAVYGTVRAVLSSEDTLGIKTNARSTNWYVEIGCMTLAGCQIHYACKASAPPETLVTDYVIHDGEVKHYTAGCRVFNADGEAA